MSTVILTLFASIDASLTICAQAILQAISTPIGLDPELFLNLFVQAKSYIRVFQSLAVLVCLSLFVFSIYKSGFFQERSRCSPVQLSIRLVTALLLILLSPVISKTAVNLIQSPLSMIVSNDQIDSSFLTSSLPDAVNDYFSSLTSSWENLTEADFEALAESSFRKTSSKAESLSSEAHAGVNQTGSAYYDSELASVKNELISELKSKAETLSRQEDSFTFQLAKIIVRIALGLFLYLHLGRLIFRILLRTCSVMVLLFISPLAYGMYASSEGDLILHSWARLFFSEVLLILLEQIFLRILFLSFEKTGVFLSEIQLSGGVTFLLNPLLNVLLFIAFLSITLSIDQKLGTLLRTPSSAADIGSEMKKIAGSVRHVFSGEKILSAAECSAGTLKNASEKSILCAVRSAKNPESSDAKKLMSRHYLKGAARHLPVSEKRDLSFKESLFLDSSGKEVQKLLFSPEAEKLGLTDSSKGVRYSGVFTGFDRSLELKGEFVQNGKQKHASFVLDPDPKDTDISLKSKDGRSYTVKAKNKKEQYEAAFQVLGLNKKQPKIHFPEDRKAAKSMSELLLKSQGWDVSSMNRALDGRMTEKSFPASIQADAKNGILQVMDRDEKQLARMVFDASSTDTSIGFVSSEGVSASFKLLDSTEKN